MFAVLVCFSKCYWKTAVSLLQFSRVHSYECATCFLWVTGWCNMTSWYQKITRSPAVARKCQPYSCAKASKCERVVRSVPCLEGRSGREGESCKVWGLGRTVVRSALVMVPSDRAFKFLQVVNSNLVWLGSLTVTCQTCNSEVIQRRRFDSAPGHCRVTILGKLFTHMCLCHQAV